MLALFLGVAAVLGSYFSALLPSVELLDLGLALTVVCAVAFLGFSISEAWDTGAWHYPVAAILLMLILIFLPTASRAGVEKRHQAFLAVEAKIARRIQAESLSPAFGAAEAARLDEGLQVEGHVFDVVFIRKRPDDSIYARLFLSGTRRGYIYNSRSAFDPSDTNGFRTSPLTDQWHTFSME